MFVAPNPEPGQNHEHQLQRLWPQTPNNASNITISCNGCGPNPKPGQHHEHQLQWLWPQNPEAGQHHEHQLQWLWPQTPNQASIMSISCNGCGPKPRTRPASRASAAMVVAPNQEPGQHHEHQLQWLWHKNPEPGQHHEHQLQWLWHKNPIPARIMSISCNGCGPKPRTTPAT